MVLRDVEAPTIFLDNQLIDGGEVVNLTHRTAVLHSQEDSWYSILLEAESLGQLKIQ
jgi:hypothetical protein